MLIFTGYKKGEPVQITMENEINDQEPLILTTLEAENTSTDNLLLALTPEIEKFTVKDSLPGKWTRKDIQKKQQELFEFENTQTPADINLPSYKLFELFFDDEVINYLCDQSKIYANSKGNFTFHITPDQLLAFLAILLISGCTWLPCRRMLILLNVGLHIDCFESYHENVNQ